MARKQVEWQSHTRRVVECGESPLSTVVVLVSAIVAVVSLLLVLLVAVFLDVLWCLRGMSERLRATGFRAERDS